jgi:hypothetical protein
LTQPPGAMPRNSHSRPLHWGGVPSSRSRMTTLQHTGRGGGGSAAVGLLLAHTTSALHITSWS